MKYAFALLLAGFLAANVRGYTDVEDPSIGGDIRSGVVFIIPSNDQCFGLEVEHGQPNANGWMVHHMDTFGGKCE